jgi:tetratricopeptide (TPR) repeat protein/tRNA A-37 threonylcarbamoyl transferase component Bud32
MINHRYNILKKLGEGGGGEVFLVEDTLKQRQQLAMKILRQQDQSDAAVDEQFRNEVSMLATLHHPNLVRMFDFGIVRHAVEPVQRGRRFFTMEYIHGLTAKEWWRDLRTYQDRVVQLKHFVLQALGVLSYVHRQGIIHFDVKPENLLLISSGDKDDRFPLLKLTDFGFSAKQDATLEFSLRGTLEYTAPELLRRETFDHRIDLYSLGATVYHLIEDRCPFEASDPVELIKKVLTRAPEFHRCAEQEYSSMLSLLTNLLQKDPARRCQSAGEAARVVLKDDPGATALAFDRLPKPGFVGREREKEQITSAVASLGKDAVGNAHVAILVSGPEGIGKTALLSEMARFVRAADIPVLEMTIFHRDVPFGAILSLLPLLRAEVMSRSAEGIELAEKFADVVGGGSGLDDSHAKELRGNWMRERDKVVEAQARFINQISLLFPLVLIVDDAHLLDPESEEVLRIVSRDARPGRLLLLAAMRGEGSLKVPTHHIHLDELDASCVSAMSTSTLSPGEVSESIGNRLYRLYGGTPALIIEALLSVSAILPLNVPRQAADMARLVESVINQLPRDIDEFLFVRYKALDRGRQLSLDILSCFKWPARREIIQAVLPFQPQRTATYLSLLEAEGFVASHDGGQRCSMRHARLKSMVYSAIQESRQDGHLFIASTMEGFPGARTFSDLQELAFQYGEGGEYTESMRWLEAAADEGMRIAAYQRARELFIEAVVLGKDSPPPELDRLNIKLAQCLFSCGDFREAIDLAEKLLRRHELEVIQQVALHKTAGLAQSRLGNYEESKQHIIAALASCADTREKVELQQELVGIEIALGNFLEAERASIAQLDRAKQLSDPRIIASVYTDLGISTFFQDLFDQSIGYFQEAMTIYTDSRQHARVADALMNIGNVESAKGDVVSAIVCWNNALKTSQDYGTLNQQAQIQNNLGIAHYKLRRYADAKEYYSKASEIFSRIESKQGKAFVLTNLGEVCFAEGQYEEALMLWEDARRTYGEMEDGRGIVETMLQLAQLHLVLGAVESVASNLDEAEALTNKKNLETFRSQLLYLRGMHMMFVNKHEAARQFFKKAEECSHESGEIAHRLLLKVRMAECDHRMAGHNSAVALAQNAMECGGKESHPQVIAEASLLLGMIAKTSPSSVPEKALPLFRKGLDAIAKEPVSEVTWKLALALGQEYRERGQGDKAREFLTKAKLVLQFLLAQFRSTELKNQYLAVESKGKVLAALESFLKT